MSFYEVKKEYSNIDWSIQSIVFTGSVISELLSYEPVEQDLKQISCHGTANLLLLSID